MKKTNIIVGSVATLLLIACGFGFLIYKNQPNPEDAFRNYVYNGIKQNQFGLEQTATGTGSALKGVGINDIGNKVYKINANTECKADYSGKEVVVKSTIQQENEKIYIRLDDISGSYDVADVGTYDLSNIFKNVKGQWYVLLENDKAVTSLLNSGIAAYNSLIAAPKYDANKLTDEIIKTKVFSYKSVSTSDDTYVYQFVSDKNAYANLLTNEFPGLTNTDLIIENIFGDKATLESVVRLSKDGKFIEESLQTTNLCSDILMTFIGEEPEGIASELSGIAKMKSYSEVQIAPVSNSQSIDKMSEAIIFE